jgi:phosphopantetheinyl transferase (holo-ACP synthase)
VDVVANDSQGLTVQSLRFTHKEASVFYASLPCGPSAGQSLTGCGMNGEGEKLRLVSALWGHLETMENSLWMRCRSVKERVLPIQVVRGLLGRPHLLWGEHRGPAISFSEGGGSLWGALCGDVFDIGIDVAGTDEFQGEYPFNRVFHPQELAHSLKLVGGDLKTASALLWSVKEAVVKALGCAFHLVDPFQIIVYPSAGRAAEGTTKKNGAYAFPVELSGKAVMRFPMAAGRFLWVRSISQEKMWLSIALLNWQRR